MGTVEMVATFVITRRNVLLDNIITKTWRIRAGVEEMSLTIRYGLPLLRPSIRSTTRRPAYYELEKWISNSKVLTGWYFQVPIGPSKFLVQREVGLIMFGHF